MSKLRVHDLAGEFGVSSDEVISLLRQMDVPVRSHLSPLSDDQVARIRARWEREKRARVAAPPAATRRRRGTAAAAPAPEPKPEAAAPADGGSRAADARSETFRSDSSVCSSDPSRRRVSAGRGSISRASATAPDRTTASIRACVSRASSGGFVRCRARR